MKPLAVLLAAGVLVAGCAGSDDPRVQVAPVTRADVVEVVEAPGAVTARATATLTAPAAGTVAAVLVTDGRPVRRGDVLLRISSPIAQERLRQALAAAAGADAARIALPRPGLDPVLDALDAAAEASFAAGRAAAAQVDDPKRRRQAQQQVADAERRYRAASAAARTAAAQAGSGAGSVETALNAVAGAQRAQAAAAVTTARQTVDALTVRAPFDGTVNLGAPAPGAGNGDLPGLVGQLPPALQGQAEQALGAGGATRTSSDEVRAGTAVTAGTPLLTVTDVAGLSVTAEVDETDVLLVKPGVRASVEVDAVPDATYPGLVTSVDLAPTTSGRGGVSYRVRVSLQGGRTMEDEPAPAPRPGMSAVVDLQVRTANDVVSVPSAAVVREDGRDAVYVVSGGKARLRRVVVGAAGADRVQILRGVEEGARVVVRDADRLRDGQSVRT